VVVVREGVVMVARKGIAENQRDSEASKKKSSERGKTESHLWGSAQSNNPTNQLTTNNKPAKSAVLEHTGLPLPLLIKQKLPL
jgi:hypothetical protein